MKYGSHFSTRETSQASPIPGKPMAENHAGGYSFKINDWQRLDRFVLLGAEAGNFYVGERELTIENAQAVLRCAKEDGKRTVARIVEISSSGRAPRNDAAIFALAICAGQKIPEALTALPLVCRIPTHLFAFVEAVKKFRGHGRSLNRAIGDWYTAKTVSDAAYLCMKYQSRGKWTHRDVLRLARPTPTSDDMKALFHWITKGWDSVGDLPHDRPALQRIWAFEKIKRTTDKKEACRLISDYELPRECVPTQFLNEPEVWEALLEDMPLTALVRNLATMTRVGLLTPNSNAISKVVIALSNFKWIKAARVHPIALLIALKIYAQGRGDKSDKTWVPVPQIIDVLNDSFYLAFGAIEPTNKRWMLGVDVSGSMSASCGGTPLSCCEAATAMALVTAHVEPQYQIMAFNDGFTQLPITKRSRLDDALKHTRGVNFGGTDCALPMLYALQNRIPVDAFVVLTDSETYANPRIHPSQALQQYRERMGIAAKSIVVGMTSSGFTIADPDDAGMLDVCGMDSAVPNLIADFVR